NKANMSFIISKLVKNWRENKANSKGELGRLRLLPPRRVSKQSHFRERSGSGADCRGLGFGRQKPWSAPTPDSRLPTPASRGSVFPDWSEALCLALAEQLEQAEEFDGLAGVLLDLGLEGGGAGELHFVAQPVQELDLHRGLLDLARKAQQERFHGQPVL